MSTLSVSNSFVASTTILSAQVNANFSAIVAWANGNIGSDNIGTLTGALAWTVASNALCLSGSNSGNQGVASFSQTGVLDASRSILKLTSSAAQTTGDAGMDVQFTNASSTIPVLRLTNDGSGNFITARTSAGATKFSVSSAGNVTAAGTLGVTGASTLTGNTSVGGTLGVTGVTTLSSTLAVTGNTTITGTLQVTGQIDRPSLPTVGQQVSASSGTYSTSSTSLADVTNLTVTITTTGRPVVLALVSDGSGNQSYMGAGSGSTDGAALIVVALRGATEISRLFYQSPKAAAPLATFGVPGVVAFDAPAAGTYTYKIRAAVDAAAGASGEVFYMKLVAFEL
jgi:hypothetical protein